MTQNDTTECITKQHNAAQRDTAQHSRTTQNHSSTSQQHNSLLFSLLTPTDQTSAQNDYTNANTTSVILLKQNPRTGDYGSALQFVFCIHFNCMQVSDKDRQEVRGSVGASMPVYFLACFVLCCSTLVGLLPYAMLQNHTFLTTQNCWVWSCFWTWLWPREPICATFETVQCWL